MLVFLRELRTFNEDLQAEERSPVGNTHMTNFRSAVVGAVVRNGEYTT